MLKTRFKSQLTSALLLTLVYSTFASTLAFADESGVVSYKSNLNSSQAHVRLFPKDYDGNWSANFTTRSLMSQNQNASAWRTEISLGYSLTSRLDFGLSEAYTVPMKFQDEAQADFDDLELNLTLALIDPKIKSPLSLSLSGVLDLPTAHYSQLQTEKFGAGIETVGSYKLSNWTITARGRVVGYAYENQYGAPSSGPNLPQNNNNPDNFNVFSDTDELQTPNETSAAQTGTANVSYYQTDALNFVYAVTEKLKVKHQNTIETFSKFDGTQMRLFHEQPGIGFKWSKHFSSWYLVDASKSTEAGGSVYQALRMTHQLALYFSL